MDDNLNQNNHSIQHFSPTSPTQPPPPHHIHTFMQMMQQQQQQQAGETPFHNNPQQQNFPNQLKKSIQRFWRDQLTRICEASDTRSEQTLPLARVKKIMKHDEQVRMISANTPTVVAKACEFFIKELTMRAWMHTKENKRRTLQRKDVANAVWGEDLLAFLKNIVPLTTNHEEPAYAQSCNPRGVVAPPQIPISIPYANWVAHPHPHPHFAPYPMNIQVINQAIGEFVHPVANNPHFTFQMNYPHRMDPAFYARNQASQQLTGSVFQPSPSPSPAQHPQQPPSSSSPSGSNPYLSYKRRFPDWST